MLIFVNPLNSEQFVENDTFILVCINAFSMSWFAASRFIMSCVYVQSECTFEDDSKNILNI